MWWKKTPAPIAPAKNITDGTTQADIAVGFSGETDASSHWKVREDASVEIRVNRGICTVPVCSSETYCETMASPSFSSAPAICSTQ